MSAQTSRSTAMMVDAVVAPTHASATCQRARHPTSPSYPLFSRHYELSESEQQTRVGTSVRALRTQHRVSHVMAHFGTCVWVSPSIQSEQSTAFNPKADQSPKSGRFMDSWGVAGVPSNGGHKSRPPHGTC
eukprot:2804051-Amphidinium_carterae.1